jgi:hypothetical protein
MRSINYWRDIMDVQEQPTKQSKGYGKRPLWQWILIYVIAAIVIYGLIYLLFIRNSGSSGY